MKCPHCEAGMRPFLSATDRNLGVSDEVFHYRRCPGCGFVLLENIPEDLGAYYPSSYYGPPPESAEALLGAAEIVERYKIELVQEHCPGAESILEIGPSMGGFAVLAKSRDYDVRAIEMSEVCVQFLTEQAGIPTVHASDEVAALRESDPVDVIALWHVIEHLPRPIELIDTAVERIRPGGYLLLAAPNPDSLQFRWLGKHWAHLDAPRHVCFLPLDMLEEHLAARGFETVLRTTTDPGSLGWNDFGWKRSLGNRLPDLLGNALGGALGALLGGVERGPGDRGSCYTLIARRRD